MKVRDILRRRCKADAKGVKTFDELHRNGLVEWNCKAG